MKKLRERWLNESPQIIGLEPEEETKKSFTIYKADKDKRLVFGWASVAITVDGETLEDRQHDMIEPEDLEDAAYEDVLNFRDTGEEHLPGYRKKGKLVESCVLTQEKQRAMGIPEGVLPVGWWIGFKIEDDDTWQRVKNGTYKMFSIEGKANREPIEKYNHNHGADGKFSSSPGAGGGKFSHSGSAKTINDISSSMNNGGEVGERWKEVRDILQSAPVGTVMTETGSRGAKFQYEKTGEDEWTSATDGYKSTDKLLSMSWVGQGHKPSVEFHTKDTAPTKQEIKDAQTAAVNGKLDQWLAGSTRKSAGAKTFEEVLKFNPFHDAMGKFSNKNGFKTYSANPKTRAGQLAIGRSNAAGHGSTLNVHRESKGENIRQNDDWIKTGEKPKIPAAQDLGGAGSSSKKPKTTPKPKTPAKPKQTVNDAPDASQAQSKGNLAENVADVKLTGGQELALQARDWNGHVVETTKLANDNYQDRVAGKDNAREMGKRIKRAGKRPPLSRHAGHREEDPAGRIHRRRAETYHGR